MAQVGESDAEDSEQEQEVFMMKSLLSRLLSPYANTEVKREMVLLLSRLVGVMHSKERKAFVAQHELVAQLTRFRQAIITSRLVVQLVDKLLSSL